MLPSSYRLPKSIQTLAGQYQANNEFTLIYQRNNLIHQRIRIVISKKIALKATKRNKYKRQINHCITPLLSKLLSFDVIIIAKPHISNITYQELCQSLNQLISSIPTKSRNQA